MFKENLLYIEEEIGKMGQADVMESAVKNRLDKSLEKYVANLESTCKYLVSQDIETVTKFLNKKG